MHAMIALGAIRRAKSLGLAPGRVYSHHVVLASLFTWHQVDLIECWLIRSRLQKDSTPRLLLTVIAPLMLPCRIDQLDAPFQLLILLFEVSNLGLQGFDAIIGSLFLLVNLNYLVL